jgi:ribose transport system ATP-binding protein
MLLGGKPFAPQDQRQAEKSGVRLVPQELNLIGNLTVAERVLLDQMPNRWGWIDYRQMNQSARQILDQVGLPDVNPTQPVHSLGLGQQQLVEIGACLNHRCDVLILDEPTAALTSRETDCLFAQIHRLQSQGVGVVFISHRIEEIHRVANRVTVLRDGRKIGTFATASIQVDDIVRQMVGRELAVELRRPAGPQDKLALRVEGLRCPPSVQEVSFELRHGEILGFAGLMGSGRTETMRAIFGADQPQSGRIYLRDSYEPAVIRSPQDAVRQGIALLTENRREQGLLLPWTIRANITLAGMNRVSRFKGWIRDRVEQGIARQWMRKLFVRGVSVEQKVNELSGGNQQKVVLARWLFRDCDILIFDEPTRGIDVAAKLEIHRHLLDLAGSGKAIIVVSSDLNELLTLSDRIAVMSGGRLTAMFHRGEWTQDAILKAALGGALTPRPIEEPI